MDQIPDLQQLMKLAQSPSGQQLLKLLQQQGGKELQQAAKHASSGNYAQIKEILSQLLEKPEVKKLFTQLEEQV